MSTVNGFYSDVSSFSGSTVPTVSSGGMKVSEDNFTVSSFDTTFDFKIVKAVGDDINNLADRKENPFSPASTKFSIVVETGGTVTETDNTVEPGEDTTVYSDEESDPLPLLSAWPCGAGG